MIETIDPHTGELFYALRTNQKFANRENQIAYNNARAKKERNKVNKVDHQIRKNWQILKDVLGENQQVEKSKQYLLGTGYDFRFVNNLRMHNDLHYYGIYDLGIRSLGKEKYEIINFNEHE